MVSHAVLKSGNVPRSDSSPQISETGPNEFGCSIAWLH